MNMRLLIQSLICTSLLATCCLAEEQAYTGDVTDVRTIRHLDKHPGAARLWEPYIAQWEGKHLVAAFGVTIPGKTDMGDILASVSRDDGDTWGDPVVIFDHNRWQGSIQFAYANAILYKPPGQDVLWCFAMRCPMVFRNSEESQLVGAFSADGGRSWSPVEMAMHYTGPLIVVAGLCETQIDGQKRYLLPAHRNTLQKDPHGSRDQFVLSSSTLLEWKLEGYIPQPETGKVFLHEGNIAPGDAPGELKMIMRTANYENDRLGTDPPRAFSSVSSDGGRTWSPAQQEPDLHNAKSKGYFGRATDGTHLYVYNDGPVGQRAAMRYKIKPTGGSWSDEKTFYDAGIKNSYPTLIEVAPGDFRAVWDSGTPDSHRTHIHFGKLKLPQ
ncbi:MAG: exo-alpha-sialidase [Phycisphaeraceae bacterium]|nr:exo-alpha-sialidase [Phycisphaeraceae bacterium]